MKDSNAWIYLVLGGLVIYWWFGSHWKNTITVPVEEVVVRAPATPVVAPSQTGDPWVPAELGYLDFASRLRGVALE
jgi:hypothetical protein